MVQTKKGQMITRIREQYIGQTKRKMITRIREHEKSCEGDLSGIQPDISNDNGIPFHYATTGHHFLFQDQNPSKRKEWVQKEDY